MQQSNYQIYRQADFNQPNYYPVVQSVQGEHYLPIAPWMGRLILPAAAKGNSGVLLEVYHADREHQYLVGDIVNLRWSNHPEVEDYVERLYRDVKFNEAAEESKKKGNVHPDRINNWHKVDPLESLAGARPEDDVIVMLPQVVVAENEDNPRPTLVISQEPIQITGRYRGLVKIVRPVSSGSEDFQVIHFNRESQEFDGPAEVIRFPQVLADKDGIFSSISRDIEDSPLNHTGWYIYGAKNAEEVFVVQAIAPRALLELKPKEVILGAEATIDYIKERYWDDRKKGTFSSVLLDPQAADRDEAMGRWQEGDRAIVMHVYGGIGGEKGEFSPMGICFGHFSFGLAQVVRDAFTHELRFEIDYKQIYTQNTDGIIAGTLAWSKYMGDRQWGWLGCRPVADILVKLDAFTIDYDFDGIKLSPWSEFSRQLDIMTGRYRIGDGTGGTYVGPTNSCVQDSFQALYVAIKRIEKKISFRPYIQDWIGRHPDHPQTRRFGQLVSLGQAIEDVLVPLEIVRSDWQDNIPTLGISATDYPLSSFFRALKSWRTMLPRLANDTVAEVLLKLGASLWVLRTNQIGGFDPDIEPIAPTDFF